METEIRRATALDAVAIVKFLKKNYGERMLPFQAVNDGLAVEFVLRMILTGLCLVAERAGRLVGVHANAVSTDEWSANRYVDNAFVCVIEPARKRGTADRMMRIVEREADRAGFWIRQGTFRGDTREAAHGRMLRMRGYQPIGLVFAREPRRYVEQENQDDQF